MYIMYCLVNASFRETILSVGITTSADTLNQLVAAMNAGCLPTPYTILTTKKVCHENSIENVYALLTKFGTYLQGNFFEISPITLQQIFDLIYDDPPVYDMHAHDDIIDHDDISEPENVILQEKYRIMQDKVEYIIPKAVDDLYDIYQIPSPAKATPVYDRLSFRKQKKYVNIDDIDL
jgi:hypothetical protein